MYLNEYGRGPTAAMLSDLVEAISNDNLSTSLALDD
jgi:hypothetical protein